MYTNSSSHFIQVDDLKSKLASQEVELSQKNEDANKLIAVVGAESEKVGKEKEIASEEEKKVQVINEEVSIKQAECSKDLAKAEPALQAAQEALNTLNKVRSSYQFVDISLILPSFIEIFYENVFIHVVLHHDI